MTKATIPTPPSFTEGASLGATPMGKKAPNNSTLKSLPNRNLRAATRVQTGDPEPTIPQGKSSRG